MEIKTKYNIGEPVWVISNNHVRQDNIATIEVIVRNEITIKYTLKLDTIYYYEKEKKLFSTKEELLKSL